MTKSAPIATLSAIAARWDVEGVAVWTTRGSNIQSLCLRFLYGGSSAARSTVGAYVLHPG